MERKLKKIKPMSCPVCGKTYFPSLPKNKKEYEIQMEYYLKGCTFCFHCGWIYELEQVENLDTYIGFNGITLNEYRKQYQEKIKEKPDYDYFEDNLPEPTPYICPVCGKYEFADHGYCEICSYCGWEDDEFQEENPDDPRGANEISLNDYKKRYEEEIKKNPNYIWEIDYKG